MAPGRLGCVLGVAAVGLVVACVSPTPSGAARRSVDPCRLLTATEASAALGGTSVSISPLGRNACVFAPSRFAYSGSGSSASTTTHVISVLEQTNSKAVRAFDRVSATGLGHRSSSGPRELRIDGFPTHYGGLVSGITTVSFHSLVDDVVISLSIPRTPGTPFELGKQAMGEVLKNFAH